MSGFIKLHDLTGGKVILKIEDLNCLQEGPDYTHPKGMLCVSTEVFTPHGNPMLVIETVDEIWEMLQEAQQ